jgi:hypothetical protein
MGRGKSKARQTKMARDLKYSKQETDLEKLAWELHNELNCGRDNEMKETGEVQNDFSN